MKHWFLCGLIVAGALSASAGSSSTRQLEADEQLAIWQHSTNLLPRGFVKDGQLQLHFAEQTQPFPLKAEWKAPRVKPHEFSFASATLEADKAPRSLPEPASGWHEVRVLDRAQSRQVLGALAERLVPVQPGHGIYCRYAFGEAVLFRDSTGKIQIRSSSQKPAELQIDRRYSRAELATAAAEAIEVGLQRIYPGERGYVVSLGGTNLWRLVFIDLVERQAAVLYPPRISQDPRRSAKLALKLSTLGSFALLDNLWPFLKNPVSSSGRTINQFHQWLITLFEPRLRQQGEDFPPVRQAPGMDLAAWELWLDEHSHGERERGSVKLLIDGDRFFPLLERRIAEARSKINFHICIFDRDDVAVRVADLLKQRSTNIEVKVVMDRLNSRGAGKAQPSTPMPTGFSEPGSISSYLRSGGKVRLRPQPNPGFTCDHSKVILIDTQYAYLGGMNVGREYRYEWHDLMAEVEGPVVASLQKQFDKKWAQVGIWGDCGLAAESVSGSPPAVSSSNQVEWIELRRLYTKTFDRQIRRAELAAIDRAANHVYLENAYLYNNDMILALARARLRGVDVRVVMPSENDFGAGHKSNLVTANYLLQHGVRVYFYPGMSHIKALEVDGWVCFGSANFDALSLRLNREANLATSNPAFAQSLRRELFEPDFEKSHELKDAVETSLGDHLADALLNPF